MMGVSSKTLTMVSLIGALCLGFRGFRCDRWMILVMAVGWLWDLEDDLRLFAIHGFGFMYLIFGSTVAVVMMVVVVVVTMVTIGWNPWFSLVVFAVVMWVGWNPIVSLVWFQRWLWCLSASSVVCVHLWFGFGSGVLFGYRWSLWCGYGVQILDLVMVVVIACTLVIWNFHI